MRPAATRPKVTTVRPAVRVANVAAVAGIVAALAALLAASLVYVVEPILDSMQGPDPCSPVAFLADQQTDPTTCLDAHPDYYHHDPVSGSYSTPSSRLSYELAPAWSAALLLAIAATLSGWLALAEDTRRRRTAISALIVGSLILVVMVVPYLAFLVIGGD